MQAKPTNDPRKKGRISPQEAGGGVFSYSEESFCFGAAFFFPISKVGLDSLIEVSICFYIPS